MFPYFLNEWAVFLCAANQGGTAKSVAFVPGGLKDAGFFISQTSAKSGIFGNFTKGFTTGGG